jgi:hypothetical protein
MADGILQTAGAKKKPAAKKPAAKKPAAKKPVAKKPAAKKPAAKKRTQKAGGYDKDGFLDEESGPLSPMSPMTEAMRQREIDNQLAIEEMRGMALNDPREKMIIKDLDAERKQQGRMGRLARVGERAMEAASLMALQNEAREPRHEKFFEVHASDEEKLAKKMDVDAKWRLPAPKRSFFGSRADKKPTKDQVAAVLTHWFGKCADILMKNKGDVPKKALTEILMENRDRIIDGYLTGYLPTVEVEIRFNLDVDSKKNPLLLNNIFDISDSEADVFDMMLHQVKFAIKWSSVETKKARTA